MSAVGTASPMAHGQAMMSTATAAANACSIEPSPAIDHPAGERRDREREHHRHEDRAHRVRELLDRGARALGIAHQPGDPLHGAVGADMLGAEPEGAGAVDRAAEDGVARPLLDRQALAGEHRLVEGAGALEDLAVDRHPFARAHEHEVAHDDLSPRAGRCSRPSRSTRAVFGCRSARARSAAEVCRLARDFERVADQHERDDEEHRLVVDVGGDAARREHVRRDRRQHRVGEGGAGAHGDERVHVGGVVPEGLPGAHVEVAAGPGHHRGRQGEEPPAQHVAVDAVEPGQRGREPRVDDAVRPGEERVGRRRPPWSWPLAAAPPMSGIETSMPNAAAARLTPAFSAQVAVLGLLRAVLGLLLVERRPVRARAATSRSRSAR